MTGTVRAGSSRVQAAQMLFTRTAAAVPNAEEHQGMTGYILSKYSRSALAMERGVAGLL